MLWLLVAGTLTFTLPCHDAADSCGETLAPCTDLDSVFLWRQDATLYPLGAIIKRALVRGLECTPWSFTYQCDTPPCQYWTVPQDTHGNRPSCAPNIYQVGGTTSVPDARRPRAWRPGRWDVQGRRMEPAASGIYFSPDSARRVVRR